MVSGENFAKDSPAVEGGDEEEAKERRRSVGELVEEQSNAKALERSGPFGISISPNQGARGMKCLFLAIDREAPVWRGRGPPLGATSSSWSGKRRYPRGCRITRV